MASLAGELLAGVEKASGLRAAGPLRVAAKSRAELEAFLAAKIAEEMPSPGAAAPYVLLGMLDEGVDMPALMLSLHMEQVAGFYEPDSSALFVLADHPEARLEPLLVHELVHALQDQHVGLDSLISPRRGNDVRAAARAAVEGHAVLATMAWGGSAPSPAGSAEAMRAAVLAGAAARHPLLAAAPPLIQESLLFPYIEGMRFAQAAQARDGNPAAALTRLPRSTEQVLHPEKVWGAFPDPPARLAFAAAGRPPPVLEDGLGRFELGLLAEAWGGSRAMADGWAGDAYALFGSPAGWSLRWVVAWDGRVRRDAFLAWAREAPGRPRGLRLRALEVGGLPALEVVAGGPPPQTAVRIAGDGERGR